MGHPAMVALPPSTEYVYLSLYFFIFWWLVIFSIHLLTCTYNLGFAKFYWDFDASFLSYSLEAYGIGMPRENFHTIAYVYVGLACVHGACVLQMLGSFIWSKLVSFSRNRIAMMNKQQSNFIDKDRTGSIVTRCFTRVYMKLGHRHGFFGVNGKYFHTILICREFLETALQTVQAIRMSKYLPHPQLNFFYIGLLVVNCWSSVLIYSRWFSRSEPERRFALVVCDGALDMMATVGVSAMILVGYVDQYNVDLAGFSFDALADDNFVAQMLNEAQMILVVSWTDMATRVIFSLGLIVATTNMKELLYLKPTRIRRVTPNAQTQCGKNIQEMDPLGSYDVEALVPSPAVLAKPKNGEGRTRFLNHKFSNKRTLPRVQTHARSNRLHVVHTIFAVWGFVLLALHIQAIVMPPLLECIPKVHPMAGALPSCFVLDFNCHELNIAGSRAEVHTQWKKFDRKTVVKLQILHCPAFTIPYSFQDLIQLQEIRIYNSSIVNWGEDVAITNTYHPKMTVLSVARTVMTDGVLPLGFQSLDFPGNLLELYFYETNLQNIPDDIDSKWHVGSSIFVENSNLTSISEALIRIQPFYLVLDGNPITEVPAELFEIYGMLYLILARTHITELPRTILYPSMNSPFIDVRDTSVSYFWSWMDPLVEQMLDISPMILAGGSTYCNDLGNITSGALRNFSAPFQDDYSSLLMNSSEQNWDQLRRAVDCSPPLHTTHFQIGDWDELYSLKS